MIDNSIIYQARLHLIIFLWPVLLFSLTFFLVIRYPLIREPSLVMLGVAFVWTIMTWAMYQFSSLTIKKRQVIMQTGFLVRQTYDIPISKIESIDIRQTILGSLLRYGDIVITGTGGTKQFFNNISHPLTCRRHMEQLVQYH